MSQQKLLKKLSIATAINPKRGFLASLVANPGDEVALLRVVGVATKAIDGVSTFGEYVEFHGEFRGTTLVGDAAGEVSMSAKAFLPSPVDALLKSALTASGNDGRNPVEFAFDIGIKHLPAKGDKEASYEYTVKTLTDTAPSDPLAALLAKVDATPLPVLAAPASTDKTEELVVVSSEKTTSKKAGK